jgi:hypothetical protein
MLLASVMPRDSVCFLAMLLLATPACNRSTTATQGRTAEAYVPVPGSVGFDIEPFKGWERVIQVDGYLRVDCEISG